jgi:hypothetical protein
MKITSFIFTILITLKAFGQINEEETKLSDLIEIYTAEKSIENISPAPVPEFKLKDLEDVKIDLKIIRKAGELGEKQTWLYKNELSPWDGVLLNPEAMAIILSEHENLILRSQLAIQTQKSLDLSKLNLETGKLRLELDALRKKSNIELAGRDAELKSCQKINKQILEDRNSIKKKLYLGGSSAAVGVVLGLLLGIYAF